MHVYCPGDYNLSCRKYKSRNYDYELTFQISYVNGRQSYGLWKMLQGKELSTGRSVLRLEFVSPVIGTGATESHKTYDAGLAAMSCLPFCSAAAALAAFPARR
jgi:hypothetical protein